MDIKLPSGRVFKPDEDIVGIDITNCNDVATGYDDRIRAADATKHPYDEIWSKEDRVALADFMIGCWQKYKDKVTT